MTFHGKQQTVLQRNKIALSANIALALLIFGNQRLPADADSGLVIVVSQDGTGDFNGADEQPIRAAIQKARQHGGGIVQIGPGSYLIRRGLKLTSGITIRGTKDALLKLASPVTVTAPAKQGKTFLRSAILPSWLATPPSTSARRRE